MILNKKTLLTFSAISALSAAAYAQSASGANIDVPPTSHSDVVASKDAVKPADAAATPTSVVETPSNATPVSPAVPAPVTAVIEVPKLAPEFMDLFFATKSSNEVEPLLNMFSSKSTLYIDDHGNMYSGKADLRTALVNKLAGKGEKIMYSGVNKAVVEIAHDVSLISGTYKAEYDKTDKTLAPADDQIWAYTAVVKFEDNAWVIVSFQTTKVEKAEAPKAADDAAPSSGTYMGAILGLIGLVAGYLFGKLQSKKDTGGAQ